MKNLFDRLPGQGDGFRYTLDWADSYDEALERCTVTAYDIHLVDYHLGRYNGLDLMRTAAERGCHAPFILLTGQGSYELDLAAMQQGVYDYLLKDQVNEYVLERTLRYAMERRQAQEELESRVRERTSDLAAANEELKREITRRTQVEENLRAREVLLRESETRFRALAETTSAAIFIVQDGRIRYANPAARFITGYNPEELIGLELWRLAHPAYQPSLRDNRLVSRWSDEVPARYEIKIIHKGGGERWVDMTAGNMEYQGQPAWVFTAFDITERDMAEQALRKARDELEQRVAMRTAEIQAASQRIETILRTLPVAVVVADETGYLVDMNGAFEQLWDSDGPLPREMIEWEPFEAWFAETGERLELHQWPLARALLRGETIIGQAIDILSLVGRRKTILNSAVPVLDTDGRVVGGVAVAQDITHQRQLERAAQAAAIEARQRADELEGLHRATATLLSTLDLDKLLCQILDAAQSAIPAAEKGRLHLVLPFSGQLEVRSTLGFGDDRIHVLHSLEDQSYPARVARERQPLQVEAAQAHALPPEMAEARSIILAPLTYGEQVLGTLSLSAGRESAFSVSNLRLLASFAATTTAALQNALLHAEIKQLAVTDPLTGQFNRRAFFDLGQRELERFIRFNHPLAAVMMDLDNFKAVNDQYGHAGGDEILRQLAVLVRANIRETDIFGRYGGDEFALLLPDTDLETGEQIALRIRDALIDAPWNVGQGQVPVSISLGVARAEKKHRKLPELLDDADIALYRAKANGRNRVELFL